MSTSKRPGRPLSLSIEERQRRIIAAAEDVFIAKGYRASSMDDVVSICGMSKRSVYQAFGTKENLFAELIASALRDAPRIELEDGDVADPEEALRTVLRRFAEVVLDPRQIALARLVVAESQHAPELANSFHNRGVAEVQRAISLAIRTLQERDLIRTEDPDLLADFLSGAILGHRVTSGLIGLTHAPSAAEIDARITKLLDLIRPTTFLTKPGAPRLRAPKP